MYASTISFSQPTERSELIKKTAQEFGTLFISMMLKAMRKTTGDNEFLPTSFGEKLYTEMLDQNYAALISANSLDEFNELVKKELERLDNHPGIPSINELRNAQFVDRFAQFQTMKPSGERSLDSGTLSKIHKWKDIIDEVSERYNIDKNLVKAVIAKESAGNQLAVSRAGAKGLMQLMDTTALEMGVVNSFSPRENITGGVKYLSQLLRKFNGNEQLALASYNAGPSAVEKYKGIPPYIETQNYVRDVLKFRTTIATTSE